MAQRGKQSEGIMVYQRMDYNLASTAAAIICYEVVNINDINKINGDNGDENVLFLNEEYNMEKSNIINELKKEEIIL
jgi:hypothetical protein